jgi:hypothetical protein
VLLAWWELRNAEIIALWVAPTRDEAGTLRCASNDEEARKIVLERARVAEAEDERDRLRVTSN